MKRYLPTLIALLATIAVCTANAPSTAQEDPWVVRAWQTENGLPQNSVTALLESRSGFLWVGTNAGLARFDGYQFRVYGLHDGLRSIRITALAEDKAGAIWVAANGGGVSRIRGDEITYFGLENGFPARGDVVCLQGGSDGSVWIGTTTGLVCAVDGAFHRVQEKDGLPAKQVRALCEDKDGALWAAVLDDGIYRGRDGKFQRMNEESGTWGPTSGAYSLTSSARGGIWAGDGNGRLYRWLEGAWQTFTTKDGLPPASLISLQEDKEGRLWICADDGGLLNYSEGRFAPALRYSELSTPKARSVLVDTNLSIWVGTLGGGLNRLSPRTLHHWGLRKNGTEPIAASSVVETKSGDWLASAGAHGLFSRPSNSGFAPLQDPGIRKTTRHITSVAKLPGSTVVWAAGEQCLYKLEDGQPTAAFLEAPVKGQSLRALLPTEKGVWIGTYYSSLLFCDGKSVRVVAPDGTFPGDITSIVAESEDVLWIGTSAGLHRWQGETTESWDTRNGLLTANIRTLARDPDGTLWIGTHGGGLARLQKGKLLQITTREGLIDDVISHVLPDDHGAIWLGSNRGLMRITRDEIDAFSRGDIAQVYPWTFGRNEGMPKEQSTGGTSPTAFRTSSGHLLFPTADGIVEVDPAVLTSASRGALTPLLDRVTVGGRSHAMSEALILEPKQHRIQIEYTAPSLTGAEWVRFRHRLIGLDARWSPASTSRRVVYEALQPGNYVFEAVAVDGLGSESGRVARYSFSVKPSFWQRPGFLVSAALALAAIGGVATWYHALQRHRVHIERLEQTRLHQAELARVGRISLLGELSASLAHELNQPLAAILANAQAALRMVDDPKQLDEVRETLKDIAESDQRASEVIYRMRAMMRKGRTQTQPREINAEVLAVLHLLHSDLIARHVRVSTELAPDLPLVEADYIQVQQVLLNLILNGCDAMKGKSPEERLITVCTERGEGGSVVVSVRDRGTGITTGTVEDVFQPFFTSKEHGLGMGLAICRAIVTSHSGKLWAENNPDGATFRFTLPSVK